ncbi:MAG: hypothetical protein U0W40_20040 [Acidimicrobiia bacterium]
MHQLGRRAGRHSVPRHRLLDVLAGHDDTPVVLVLGGAGYGKTTLLDQWCEQITRPVVRVALRPRHDDGTAFLAALVDALDDVEPVTAAARRRVLSPDLDWSSVVLPAMSRLLARRTVPCTIVLDDVHFLRGDGPLAVLDVLIHGLGDGWQLVLAARTEPEIGTAKLQVDGRLLVIPPEELLMTASESVAVLRALDPALDDDTVDAVARRAEGWPVALYLSAMGLRGRAAAGALDVGFPGDDAALARYLRQEVLRRLNDDTRDFLLHTAVLEELHPSLCDAVLDRSDSAATLQSLAAEHTFVRPSDTADGCFRVHQLLRELLGAELQREESAAVPGLHRRASEWYAASGDILAAVEHALASGDDAYTDALVWGASAQLLGGGYDETVGRWLEGFPHDAKLRRPAIAAVAGWHALITGDSAGVRVWTEVVETMDPAATLPDGSTVTGTAALLRAISALDGTEAMLRDCETARAGHRPTSPFWSMVLMLQGTALRLLDRADEAAVVFEEGVALTASVNAAGYAQCLAGLGRIAAARDDWDTCVPTAVRCVDVVEMFGIDQRPAMCGPVALAAVAHARAGASEPARRCAKQAAFLVGMLRTSGRGPWSRPVSTSPGAELLLGDPAAARPARAGTGQRALRHRLADARPPHRRVSRPHSTPSHCRWVSRSRRSRRPNCACCATCRHTSRSVRSPRSSSCRATP